MSFEEYEDAYKAIEAEIVSELGALVKKDGNEEW